MTVGTNKIHCGTACKPNFEVVSECLSNNLIDTKTFLKIFFYDLILPFDLMMTTSTNDQLASIQIITGVSNSLVETMEELI